jgi:putative molybdopterin biosynthesis protein
MLLDKAMGLFNTLHSEHVAVFGNLGSMGGITALRQNLCHIASSHLIQDDESDYNFDFAHRELSQMPAVVNFCRREQGLIVAKGNPKKIERFKDLGGPTIRVVNRPLGTGTRLLFDRELEKAGLRGEKIHGYGNDVQKHLDVGLEILAGRADAGPGIRPVASLLGLDFIPIRWERYDLLIRKERFFDRGVQLFLGIFHEKAFLEMAKQLDGYDLAEAGKMVFKQEPEMERNKK